MKMCNFDKFLSYVEECADFEMFDFNQKLLQSESYNKCNISNLYSKLTGLFLYY